MRSITVLLALLTVAAGARAQPAPGSAGRPATGYTCGGAGASSPAIDRLRAAIQAADAATVDALVGCLAEIETPVIEPAPSPGRHLVTFPFVGDSATAGVRLDSNVVAVLIDGIEEDFESLGAMDRIGGTDLWITAMELPDSLRAPYRVEVTPRVGEARLVLDPRNPRVYEDHWTENFRKSELVLPGAPAQPWRARPGRAAKWEVHEVAGRELAVYAPPAAIAAGTPRPVVLALGTMTFYNVLPTGRLIDHLVEEGAIEPPIVITVDLAEGADVRRFAGEAAFLADTLLPWARSHWPISTAPEEVIVTGTSRRGLAATIAAFERPDAVGMALPLSGSFYWRPEGEEEFEWLTRRFAEEPRRHIQLYVTAGTLETVVTPTNRGHYQLATARHLRDVLEAKEYDFVYMEFVGVHDEMNWQSALADGLRALLPRR